MFLEVFCVLENHKNQPECWPLKIEKKYTKRGGYELLWGWPLVNNQALRGGKLGGKFSKKVTAKTGRITKLWPLLTNQGMQQWQDANWENGNNDNYYELDNRGNAKTGNNDNDHGLDNASVCCDTWRCCPRWSGGALGPQVGVALEPQVKSCTRATSKNPSLTQKRAGHRPKISTSRKQ